MIQINKQIAESKKMAMLEKKTVTRTVSIPQTKVVKQPQQQSTQQPSQSKNTSNDDTDAAALASVRPQPPLPNQQIYRDKRWKHTKSARFIAVWQCGWHNDWVA